ncbi:hypothetical protein [Rhizobium bangladeshense]|uniref:hypothetical protein n=1 Tax=Rhizobium bangladeshense TaxID=1138189 RepID=UPI0007E5B22C|nr:hypothetical protein [Rhizobium bangladeshense]
MKLSVSEDEFSDSDFPTGSFLRGDLDTSWAVAGKRCDVFLVEDEFPRVPATLAVTDLRAALNF